MRKTKVTYKGGLVGANSRLVMAAKQSMVMPFSVDEATAYLAFLADRKSSIQILRKRLESVVLADFPKAEMVYERPESFDAIAAMVIVLKAASKGDRLPYTPEMASALLGYVEELKGQENGLYDMLVEAR